MSYCLFQDGGRISTKTECTELPGFNKMNGPRCLVTTSWDDGDPLDLGIAKLLSECGVRGTFYVPLRGHHGSQPMGSAGLIALADGGFEIGAHGVSRPDLTKCNPQELFHEVSDCKQELESTLGRPVRLLAYPRGRHDRRIIETLKEAGYSGARTTRMLARDIGDDPFRMPTTVQAYPHRPTAYIRNFIRARQMQKHWRYVLPSLLTSDWTRMAKAIFDSVLEWGGVWHLYGHSWEIAALGLWEPLRDLLTYVSGREGVLYLDNSGVLAHFNVGLAYAESPRETPPVYGNPVHP